MSEIEISKGKKEKGIEIGNYYDKYNTKNPIAKVLVGQFEKSIFNFLESIFPRPEKIVEVGCGEGFWTLKLNQLGYKCIGYDFSESVIHIARKNAKSMNLDPEWFQVKSIYDLKKEDSAPLILCLEVLEHLEYPDLALSRLQEIAIENIIFSVPREPLWRFLNLLRGKYISDFGNTPGHIQHWSTKSFIQKVSEHFRVVSVSTPIPWTILLCRKKETKLQKFF